MDDNKAVNIEASQELVSMALQSETETVFTLLIGSANRLDPRVSIEKCRTIWLNRWMEAEKEKRSKLS